MTVARSRILLHDYGGYGFIAQMARELARRGHQVNHVHFASLRNGKGSLVREPDDPPSLTFDSIEIRGSLDRYQVADRLRLERAYARKLTRRVDAWQPDVVIAANTPLFVLRWLNPSLNHAGVPLVNWLQDLHSVAMGIALIQRFGMGGRRVSDALQALEARLLRSCAGIVAVTPDFLPILNSWRVATDRVTVAPNWAELGPVAQRANAFSTEHDLDGRITLLYSGTIGLKHDPLQLVQLAEAFRHRPDVRVVVISEGLGRNFLENARRERRLDNMVLVDFQPSDRVPEVLGSGDVLLSIIQPEASVFSVPSKVLAYLAAGRAQLSSIPSDNLAARVLRESGAGVIAEPDAPDSWTSAAARLVDDPEWRQSLGRNGRAYAEEHFDVGSVADTFEEVIASARAGPKNRRRAAAAGSIKEVVGS